MRWLKKCATLLAVSVLWVSLPGVSRAGWITLVTGPSGSAQPTHTSEFWYGSSSVPPFVAIDALSGTGNVQAVTDGGRSFFSGSGLPVLLTLSDGAAYLTGGSPPTGVTPYGPGGQPIGPLASSVPEAGVPIPVDAARLGLTLATDWSSAWVLTASVLGSEGTASGSVIVPEGGWWVLGLGTGQEQPTPEPEPGPGPGPSPTPGVPEPTVSALAASGALLLFPWLRRKVRATGAQEPV
ncbi:hypothetical protein GobsT_57940 [Gemmata obscuriglobus]|nr:hypothetical protein GobsT_57940 [Gemmata obscuriglobus]VTS10310.1 unnamed protein product [Gemmata obscuriglobus UQM 2246]